MKRFLYPLLFLLAVSGLNRLQAQDEAIFSHYIINPILINPAVAGFQEEGV
jgi:bacteriorhodopsin